jgi:hypothetical protein
MALRWASVAGLVVVVVGQRRRGGSGGRSGRGGGNKVLVHLVELADEDGLLDLELIRHAGRSLGAHPRLLGAARSLAVSSLQLLRSCVHAVWCVVCACGSVSLRSVGLDEATWCGGAGGLVLLQARVNE